MSKWMHVPVIFGVLCGAAAADVTLVEDGRARAVIVVAPDAAAQAREAAEILRQYVGRMSGARLEMAGEMPGDGAPCVVVGAHPALKALGVEAAPRFTSAMDEEFYIVKTVGNVLVLVGNDHPFYRGTVYAVDEFLERLGCRWFFPGAFGEVVPNLKTIKAGETDIVSRPDFRLRNVWYSGWMPVTEQDAADYRVWMDRNKMNTLAGLSLPGDGTVTRVAPPEQYFESHPHIYAVDKEGKRTRDMLCMTEPEAVAIAAETIKAAFRADPAMVTYGFAPPDGHPMCHCPRCEAANPGFSGKGYGDPSLSDIWFGFANAVAKEVNKEFPERWLLTNGYANRVRPPEGVGPLSPNLGIQSAMLDTCNFHPIGDSKCWQRQMYQSVLERWTRDLRCVFVYDYDPGKGLDGLPFPMLHNLEKDIPWLRDRGVWGFWTEGQNCWFVTHLNYYIRARLMWDADADVKELVRDYCDKFYGPAAGAVEDYIWTMEEAVDRAPVHETFGRLTPWRVVYPPKVMARLDRAMDKAVARAVGAPEAGHVHALHLAHQYLLAYMAMESSAAAGDFAAAVAQADRMLALRAELGQINPSLIPVTPEWCAKGDASLEWHRATYLELAERVDGTRGALAAMTPQAWQFRKDSKEEGIFGEWYLSGNGGKWDELDSTLYWEAQGMQDRQGYGYTGKAWYRVDVEVPSTVAGKPVSMCVGGMYSDKLWVWVNGRLTDHRFRQNTRNPFDIDITPFIRPGETNTIAFLVDTLPPDRNARGGLHRRVFLWSPKADR